MMYGVSDAAKRASSGVTARVAAAPTATNGSLKRRRITMYSNGTERAPARRLMVQMVSSPGGSTSCTRCSRAAQPARRVPPSSVTLRMSAGPGCASNRSSSASSASNAGVMAGRDRMKRRVRQSAQSTPPMSATRKNSLARSQRGGSGAGPARDGTTHCGPSGVASRERMRDSSASIRPCGGEPLRSRTAKRAVWVAAAEGFTRVLQLKHHFAAGAAVGGADRGAVRLATRKSALAWQRHAPSEHVGEPFVLPGGYDHLHVVHRVAAGGQRRGEKTRAEEGDAQGCCKRADGVHAETQHATQLSHSHG